MQFQDHEPEAFPKVDTSHSQHSPSMHYNENRNNCIIGTGMNQSIIVQQSKITLKCIVKIYCKQPDVRSY